MTREAGAIIRLFVSLSSKVIDLTVICYYDLFYFTVLN